MPTPPITLPKKIHFIWIGGAIPAKYYRTIAALAVVAKQSDFEINLWVDRISNFHKAAVHQEIQIPHLQLREIDELKEKMQVDPFYQQDDRLRKFTSILAREMVGLKNLAAAADLLRYEILRQEGGYYADVDTLLPELDVLVRPKAIKLIADAPDAGVITNFKGNTFPLFGNNDLLAALPHHEVLETAILTSLSRYDQLDHTSSAAMDKLMATKLERGETPDWRRYYRYNDALHILIAKQGPSIDAATEPTLMDKKRSPFEPGPLQATGKGRYTLYASGPDVIHASIEAFWGTQPSKTRAEPLWMYVMMLTSLPKNAFLLAGLTTTTKNDLNWLLVSKIKQAFDTNALSPRLMK